VRDGVKRILEEQPRAAVFGEAGTPEEALACLQQEEWDVVILDISLGGKSGLELLRDMRQVRPAVPVLILSMHSEEQYARRAFKAGAAGYVMKDSPRTALLAALDKVLQGGRYVSPALAERLVVDLDTGTDRPLHEKLSHREFEVMRLMGAGRTITGIAELLALSDKTVSTYRARILEKLQLKTTSEIVRYVIEHNLLD
jgi:two-component system, NarL family, invasion response regulator UvrY